MENTAHNEQSDATRDVPLCHNCLSPNDPRAYFCHKCNTPLSVLASMDPIARIWSMGDTWRKAASRPYRPIILIGMWLLFGTRLVVVLRYLHMMLVSNRSKGLMSLEGFFGLGLWLGYGILLSAILFKTTRNYLRIKQQQAAEPPDVDDAESV